MSLFLVAEQVWGKRLGVSANPTMVATITLDCHWVSNLGPGLGFPATWTNDFSDVATTDPSPHSLEVSNQILANRFIVRIR